MWVIFIAVVVNLASCLVFRMWWHGRMNITVRNSNRYEGTFKFYFAGMLNQPWEAFRAVQILVGKKTNAVLFQYSAFGWSPKTAARQFTEFCESQDRLLGAVIYAISVGAKVRRYIPDPHLTEYAINPCPDPSVLKPSIRKWLPAVAALMELMSIVLGWLAMLPILPADASPYSLTLLADQIWQIAVVSCKPGNPSADGIIVSKRDEFLDNAAVKRYYYGATVAEINTSHGATADRVDFLAYRGALTSLEQKVSEAQYEADK